MHLPLLKSLLLKSSSITDFAFYFSLLPSPLFFSRPLLRRPEAQQVQRVFTAFEVFEARR
jgi:hypothetical protein